LLGNIRTHANAFAAGDNETEFIQAVRICDGNPRPIAGTRIAYLYR
jgi:hypothetical protein